MPRKVDELKQPPVKGQTYLVKCIWATPKNGGIRWLPIFGDPHIDDTDTSNGEPDGQLPHWHYDTRFFTDGDCYVSGWDYTSALVVKLNQGLKRLDRYSIKYKKRKMAREWPLALWPHSEYLARFEQRYMDRKLDLDCKKCPHWGADLRSVPVIDGKILCPLHRLLWDAKNGSLVPTMQKGCKAEDGTLVIQSSQE